MGLSLAQSSRKTRIGSDPRNTQWANDTDRFGHQQMLRMGWKPGRGLGSSVEGAKDHIKVTVKTDAKGLGHRQGEADQPTGLDVFQKILGKLNGTEQEVEEQIQKRERSSLYLQFVPGGVLEGTVKSTKELKKQRKSAEREKKKVEAKLAKLAKRDKKAKSGARKGADSGVPPSDQAGSDGASASASAEASTSTSPEPATPVAEARTKSPSELESTPEPERRQARGIRATRNKYIAMKKQATADSKGLKEILML